VRTHEPDALEQGAEGERPPRALVVDDDRYVRDLLAELLTGWGFEVSVAADGREGAALCDGAAYDLLLTDYRMPGATGLELVEAVRRAGSEVGIIMLTASLDDLEDQRRRYRFMVLRKPLDITDLRAAIARTLAPVS
jgi:CheY-like chemotaxis protein